MPYTIKEMPEEMRPREKLAARGEAALSDSELLAIIVGQGIRNASALHIADRLLVRFGGFRYLREASLEELTREKGIGLAKAVNIKAAIEIGRRIAQDVQNRTAIHSPGDVHRLLSEEMRYYDREHFRALYLDRKGGLLTMQDISVGGLHSSLVHPREVFKPAIKRSAASIILVHNHPSGDPTPSFEDIEATRRLVEVGTIMGIEIIDHIIIGENNYCSFKQQDLI